jgi:hypothetical protein
VIPSQSAWGLLGALLACAPPPVRLAPAELDARARSLAATSILRVVRGIEVGTTFACIAPGLGCTAAHVVGDAREVTVESGGKSFVVPVVAKHPLDDIALLDLRAVRPAPPPLAVSPFDTPREGVMVCRLGRPPERPTLFVRCDPLGGILFETTKSPGVVLARLIHLGVGFKGDSGAPLVDLATGLVLGIHVSEANGSARAATSSAILDVVGDKAQALGGGCAREAPVELARLVLGLRCEESEAARAERYRRIGVGLLDAGRRGEALSAFEEVLTRVPTRGDGWLWRAVVFPGSAHARDDAALALRLDARLREDAGLAAAFAGPHLDAARALRDEVAPPGARLATLVGPGACGACPAFCAAAGARADIRLWAVDSANHPAAEKIVRAWPGGAAASSGVVVAVDGRAGACGKLSP